MVGKEMTKKTTTTSSSSTHTKSKWKCHICGEGGKERRGKCTCGAFIHWTCKANGVCNK